MPQQNLLQNESVLLIVRQWKRAELADEERDAAAASRLAAPQPDIESIINDIVGLALHLSKQDDKGKGKQDARLEVRWSHYVLAIAVRASSDDGSESLRIRCQKACFLLFDTLEQLKSGSSEEGDALARHLGGAAIRDWGIMPEYALHAKLHGQRICWDGFVPAKDDHEEDVGRDNVNSAEDEAPAEVIKDAAEKPTPDQANNGTGVTRCGNTGDGKMDHSAHTQHDNYAKDRSADGRGRNSRRDRPTRRQPKKVRRENAEAKRLAAHDAEMTQTAVWMANSG